MKALDEQADRLTAWLTDRLHEADRGSVSNVSVSDVAKPGAGQSNDTWIFRARWTIGARSEDDRFVLRRQPSGNQLFHDPDVIREGRVLRGVGLDGRVPVPEVLWLEPDPEPLGAPFFVMRHVEGHVPLARPSIHAVGWLTELTPVQRQGLWSSAMDALVAVHAVDWTTNHGFLLQGSQDSLVVDHVARLAAWYRWTTGGRTFPVTDAAVERLVQGAGSIETTTPVLVWGDARVGNMIFAPTTDKTGFEVAAVIDWEVASIGVPAIDVAHWLFFEEFLTTASGVTRLEGFPDRATTIGEYERRSDRALEHLEYFELMEETFIATTLIRQADIRVERGLAPAHTRMGHDNAVTQMIARRLGLAVPDLSPDYLAHRGIAPAQP